MEGHGAGNEGGWALDFLLGDTWPFPHWSLLPQFPCPHPGSSLKLEAEHPPGSAGGAHPPLSRVMFPLRPFPVPSSLPLHWASKRIAQAGQGGASSQVQGPPVVSSCWIQKELETVAAPRLHCPEQKGCDFGVTPKL